MCSSRSAPGSNFSGVHRAEVESGWSSSRSGICRSCTSCAQRRNSCVIGLRRSSKSADTPTPFIDHKNGDDGSGLNLLGPGSCPDIGVHLTVKWTPKSGQSSNLKAPAGRVCAPTRAVEPPGVRRVVRHAVDTWALPSRPPVLSAEIVRHSALARSVSPAS